MIIQIIIIITIIITMILPMSTIIMIDDVVNNELKINHTLTLSLYPFKGSGSLVVKGRRTKAK